MTDWWNLLELMQRVLWCIAGASTVIFIIQAIMTFVGMDSDGGLDMDVDTDISAGEHPFQLFTLRNFVNFLLGFGWAGLVFYDTINNPFFLALISALFGCILVALVMFIFFQLSKMVQSGNISIEETVGLSANVYLTIAGHRERAGKVQVSVKGSIREYDAVTDSEALKTGELAKIEKVLEGNILLVTKL